MIFINQDIEPVKTINHVRQYLALGSRLCAENRGLLVENGIDAILSLAATKPGLKTPHLTVEFQDRVPLPDAAIVECMGFIKFQLEKGRRVLLHCEMGISRSPSICACYLHEHEGLPLEEAHKQVKAFHPAADPHPALVTSIKDYYAKLAKLRHTRTGAVKHGVGA
ncbi:MAG: dual specificity protein phosphatase family protein [Deltaproteobacteria bacterium]|jgi:predicted protein tyrosine phosphatase|nr:dual specificity protein phosphatase family protein [Deltaproteobacteria bacterium]